MKLDCTDVGSECSSHTNVITHFMREGPIAPLGQSENIGGWENTVSFEEDQRNANDEPRRWLGITCARLDLRAHMMFGWNFMSRIQKWTLANTHRIIPVHKCSSSHKCMWLLQLHKGCTVKENNVLVYVQCY